MAGQQLTTTIVINARTGSGFGKVGATLTELGTLVNGLSQELISFGKESTEIYRDYEKSMQDAKVALSTTYGRGTKELNDVMEQLDAAATEWAATSIFHTDDVSHAISEAAHAGWDYEQIMLGLPAAMELAQGGSIDLSEAVNYIVKSTYAAGVGFDELQHFTDIWTYAANNSASTVEEFGEAMLRMGSTMRFADNEEELMTLIAVMANSGVVGTEAGTLIRNSMMRLIAPTKKANEALTAMGATTEELAEIAGDENLAAAYERLVEYGFHGLYDENGQMRSVLDVYSEMAVILGDMAGGMDKIADSEEAMQIIGSIFPVRSLTGALNLLNAASENYDGLYDKMMAGAAEGYGAYAAETMMDTLNGDIEIFNSKVERLKQVVGGQLKDQVEDFAGFAGEIVDSLAEMDPDAMSALIKGLEVVAAAGPALLLAGGAFRLIGALMTPAGAITAGVIALAAGAAILMDLKESRFEENFGDMALDMGKIESHIQGIGDGFRAAYQEANQFRAAAQDAINAYTDASSSLSSRLMSDMLANTQLTDEDIAEIERLVDQMDQAMQSAVSNSAAASESYWTQMFLGTGSDYDAAYQQIMELTSNAASDAMLEAEGISQELRNALTSAFADGEISQEEYQNILSYMQDYNDAIARAAAEAKSEEDYIKAQKLLYKAQTASWDEIKELADEATADRDSVLAEQEEQYLTERFKLEYRGADVAALAQAEERFNQQQNETRSAYDKLLLDMYETAFQQSDMSGGFEYAEELAQRYLRGEINSDEAVDLAETVLGSSDRWAIQKLFGSNTREDMITAENNMWASLGYGSDVEERIRYYEGIGNEEMAARFRSIYAQHMILNGSLTDPWKMTPYDNFLGIEYNPQPQETQHYGIYSAVTGQEITSENAYLYGYDPYAAERARVAGEPQVRQYTGPNSGATVTVYTGEEMEAMLAQLESQHPEIELQGNFDALDTGIAERDGQSITVYVDEQPSGGGYGKPSGATGTGRGTMRRMTQYSKGGRATEASIFGEGDVPEWAIPEEHTPRAAALLNAARAASGFTWPDLLSMFGGMNANANNSPTTFVYSPVIHANDASGVESVLRDDKARMERWFEEKRLRDGMEVYT